MKVLILAAAPLERQADSDDGGYPVLLAELGKELLLERMVRSCGDAQVIFAIQEAEVRRFRLDSVIAQVAPDAELVQVHGQTAGAACTALLAAPHISGDEELLILNANEVLDFDFAAVLAGFRAQGLDAGVAAFPSVHPRYSYVRLDAEGMVIEAAEKNPISRNATVGFYWFRHGRDFRRAAEGMIRKDGHLDGVFYICPALNELVLEGARIGMHAISAEQYYPVKSARQLEQFEVTAQSRFPARVPA
ncbi:glycosyltransferase family 2 protein [Rhodovarius lipocyclicus]|uniref:glycosyltransferase family 2 protein n=1 Tax=Rhodovarius lipocyclicus TaxID=268410 RepID=UPI001357A3DD|nr:glycosyltransferase family 2 protein [Rhodovarius lipocyclicus]